MDLATLTGRAHFGTHNRMGTDGGAFFADFAAAARVRENFAANTGFTLELVLTPRVADEQTRGWIVALDTPEESGTFVLAQRGKQLVLGDPESKYVVLGELEADKAHHLLLRAGPDAFSTYLNGTLRAEHEHTAPQDIPQAPALVFGGSIRGDHDWRGTLEGVAWYDGILSPEQTAANAALWAKRLQNRREPLPLTIRATLLEKSEAAEASSYPRSLVAYRYRVHPDSASVVKSEHVVVYHWGVLGGKPQPILELPLQSEVELKLLPPGQVPSLEREHKAEDIFDPEAEAYYAPL